MNIFIEYNYKVQKGKLYLKDFTSEIKIEKNI